MKRGVFDVIQPSAAATGRRRVISSIFDDTIMALIVFSVLSVFICTFKIPDWLFRILIRIEFVSIIVFTIEYALRIWTANLLYPELNPIRARIRYVTSPMAIIDLISILPFLVPVLHTYNLVGVRVFRLVRLLRIFKLNRYSDALAAIGDVFRRKSQQMVASVFFVSMILILASLLIYYAEHDAQPDQFENAFSGLWWAVATLTTVGYGDIYPITPLGRFLGAIIAILGIGMVAVPTSILSAGFMEVLEKETSAEKEAGRESAGKDGKPDEEKSADGKAAAAQEDAPAHPHAAPAKDDAFEPPQYCPHCGKKLFP
ncbi:MAG: ion transporter [Lentisphaeria bacterium]|nr:ion transporter [Lentisphaeria bacterium]